MSEYEYSSLIFEISEKLDANVLPRLVFMCRNDISLPKGSEDSIQDVLTLFKELEKQNCLGIDRLVKLKEILTVLKKRSLLKMVNEFETKRKAQSVGVISSLKQAAGTLIGAVRLVCNFRTLAGGAVLVGSGLALRSFTEYSDAFGKVIIPAYTKLVELSEKSSLSFTVQAETPSALNELWSIHKNGTLKHRLQEFLVTEEIKQLASGEDIEVTVYVDEQEYREAYLDLMLQQNQADSVYPPMTTQQKMKEIVTATMEFEAEHEECVRVLPYLEGDQVVVQSYVFSGESGIPKHLKLAAKESFREMEVELKWSDLYNDAANILKVTPLKYPSGQPKRLNASQVDKISEIISKNLYVLDQHRNVTSVQASFKITESKQTENPCITIYVLGKGFIPVGESEFPHTLGPYSVDVVDGFWFRTCGPWQPNKAQEQSKVLCLGASIGVEGEEASGTLGAIVEDGGTLYALSCNHVMKLSTKSEIIHPGLNDHLNYLKYHLQEYRELIKANTACGSLEDLTESEELSEKFKGLKSIKKKHLNSECAEQEIEDIQKHEEAIERGLKPPRVIGNYSAGVSGNVKWTDGKEYFVDVAIAELTEGEIYSLRKSKTVRMINTTKRISGDCSETTTKAIMNADKLCKSGRTTQYTETDRLVGPGMEPPAFMMAPRFKKNESPLFDAGLHNYFCKKCAEQRPYQSEKKEITGINTRCKSCQKLPASLCEEHWCKNCLCIVNGRTKFADEGDSGAVIFELKEGLPGFGIIFAVHENAYQTCVIASPLQVCLEALSKEIKSSLRLVSNFVAPEHQAPPPEVAAATAAGPNGCHMV